MVDPTPADAIKSALDTNWNVGTGGTKPTLAVTEDITQRYPDAQETIVGRTWTYRHREVPVDSTFVNRFHDITFRVSTSDITSAVKREDRLAEMFNEVKRIFRANGVTGFHVARVVTVDQSPSDKSRSVFRADLGIHLIEYLVNAATVAGSTASRDLAVGGDLIVTGDIKALTDIELDVGNKLIFDADADSNNYFSSNLENRILTIIEGIEVERKLSTLMFHFVPHRPSPTSSLDIGHTDNKYKDAYFTGDLKDGTDSISVADLAVLLMFGSANAADVPMQLAGANLFSYVRISAGWFVNLGADNVNVEVKLPISTNRGGLKLYISNLYFGVKDADEDDFVTSVTIRGQNGSSDTTLDTDNTDHKTTGNKTFSGAVMPASAIDCSGYQTIVASFVCSNTDAADLDFGNIRMECYYAA